MVCDLRNLLRLWLGNVIRTYSWLLPIDCINVLKNRPKIVVFHLPRYFRRIIRVISSSTKPWRYTSLYSCKQTTHFLGRLIPINQVLAKLPSRDHVIHPNLLWGVEILLYTHPFLRGTYLHNFLVSIWYSSGIREEKKASHNQWLLEVDFVVINNFGIRSLSPPVINSISRLSQLAEIVNDVDFQSCSLHVDGRVFWSSDGGFGSQSRTNR